MQRNVSMVALRSLGYGKKSIENKILEEAEQLISAFTVIILNLFNLEMVISHREKSCDSKHQILWIPNIRRGHSTALLKVNYLSFQEFQGVSFKAKDLLDNAVANIVCCLLFGDRYEYGDKEFVQMRQNVDKAFEFISTATLVSRFHF